MPHSVKPCLLFITIFIGLLPLTLRVKAQTNHQEVTNGNFTTAINFPGTCTYNWTADNTSIGIDPNGAGNGIAKFKAVNNGSTRITVTITATPQQPRYAYIPNYVSGDVSVVDLSNNTRGINIPTGQYPYGVATSADGTKAYVTNTGPNTVTVINTADNATHQIPLGPGSGRGLVVSPDGSRVYIANTDLGIVNIINTATETVLSPITVGQKPIGMAISPDGSKVYVTNYDSHSVSVINTANNTVQTIDVKPGPHGVTVSADGKLIYITNELDDKVTIIDAATNTVKAFFSVGATPYGIAVSPDGRRLYVSCAVDNKLWIVDANTHAMLRLIQVGNYPYGVAINGSGSTVYVSNINSNDVSVINTATYNIDAVVNVGTNPYALGNSISQGISCSPAPIQYTITVNPAGPVITAGTATGDISACAGTPSPGNQNFSVSGSNLTADITATAPNNFEISLNPNSGFAKTIVLRQTNGSVAGQTVYIRSAAGAAPGSISGDVTLNSASSTNTVAVNGVVAPLPKVDALSSKTYLKGETTSDITFTGTGTFTWTNDRPDIGMPATGTGTIPSFTATNAGNTPIKATITVTPGSPALGYVANFNAGTVSVIDVSDNSLVTSIATGASPTDVAVSPDGSRIFVCNSASNTVSVINTAINKVINTISVGNNPQRLFMKPDGTRLYVSNSQSGYVSVLDLTGAELGRINVPSSPYSMCMSPDQQWLYLIHSVPNAPQPYVVSVVSTASNTIKTTIPVNGPPTSLVLSPDGSRLYVSTITEIDVINTGNYQLLAPLPFSFRYDLAMSKDGTQLYATNRNDNTVSFINLANNTLTTVSAGISPAGIAVSADGSTIYVPSQGTNLVSVIDTKTHALSTINVQEHPVAIVLSQGTGCSGVPVSFNITVNVTAPTVNVSGVTGAISACEGTVSVSPNIQQFTVSGSSLTQNIDATAPSGFEISFNPDEGYAAGLILSPSNGAVADKVIYVRSLPRSAGNVTGQVTLASGAISLKAAVTATINASLLVNTPASQVKENGEYTNPVSFTGTAAAYNWTNDLPALGFPAGGQGDIASFKAINTGTAPVTANITVTPIPGSYAYVASPGANSVTVIDAATDKVKTIIKDGIGQNPIDVALSIDGSKAYVLNQQSNTVSVISTITNKVTATIPVDFGPTSIVMNPDGSRAYVANINTNTVSVINLASNAVTPITTQMNPGYLAISKDGNVLYVLTGDNGNVITLYDAHTYTLIKTMPINKSAGLFAVSADGNRIYLPNQQEGTLTVYNITDNTNVVLPVQTGPSSAIISADGNYVYVSNSLSNTLSVYHIPDNVFIKTIPAGQHPAYLALSTDGSKIYVGDITANTISVINTATNVLQNSFEVSIPYGIAFSRPAAGCSGLPVQFTITVNPGTPIVTQPGEELIVPNAFSPNGDGVNDTWQINFLAGYPNNIVNVYNRYGINLYSSIGYSIPWDGRYKGKNLPSGTYYYIINPKNGNKVISGSVTIIR